MKNKTTVTNPKTGQLFEIERQYYNEPNNFYIIILTQSLTPGSNYELTLAYEGILDLELAGYYRSSYLDPRTNETKWLAVTDFEPIKARKAFPCFDEPGFKATFKITLGHDKDLTALSNMPVVKSTPM